MNAEPRGWRAGSLSGPNIIGGEEGHGIHLGALIKEGLGFVNIPCLA